MDTTAIRLRALQSLVASSSSLDALLLIGGVDGKNHAGSRECLNWVLNGLNGRDVFGYTRLDSLLEEAIFLVTADSARLYTTRALWAKLEPRLGRVRRLQVWMPDAAAEEDVEEAEAHKIRAFIAMVRDLKAVGVPLPAADAGSGPAAAVEAWPLVQAYALQDFEALTGGGFFTQTHTVSGVGEAVRALLLQLDAPSLAWLGFVESPRLAGCLSDCLGALDLSCDAGRPFRQSEAELFEPALAYHTHGQLRANDLPKASALPSNAPPDAPAATTPASASGHALRRVGCLIGKRSSLLCTGGAGGASAMATPLCEPSPARPGESGGPEAAPRHVCAELAEPMGPLYAGRTYFLGSGARAPPRDITEAVEDLVGPDEDAGPIKPKSRGARGAIAAAAAAAETSAFEDPRCTDSDRLQGLYGCLVAAVDAVAFGEGPASAQALCADAADVGVLTRRLAAEFARFVSLAELQAELQISGAENAVDVISSRLSVQASFADLLGSGYTGRDAADLAGRGSLLINLRVVFSLSGATSASGGDGESLGALLLGDTYACVPGGGPGGGLVSLSAGVPRYEVWRASGPETDASTDLGSACETAVRITFGHESASNASAGSIKPKMPAHALVGGLLGQPVADALDGCALLPSRPSLQPLECTLYAFERGAVLQHARAGSMLLLFDAGLSPRRVELHEHTGTSVTLQAEGDPLLDALTGKKPSVSISEAAAANAAAAAAAAETERADGLPREACTLLRLWYTVDILQSVLGARAAFLAGSNPSAESGGLVDFTIALSRSAARRILRRQILPQWREQWAKKGTECDVEAPPPPALRVLPAETILGAWPTRAFRAATKGPSAVAPAPPESAGEKTAASGARCVQLLLLTGMPGPALQDAAAGTVHLTSNSVCWLPSPDGAAWCDGCGQFDVPALVSILTASLRAAPPGSKAAGRPEQLILTTHGIPNDLPTVVAAVCSACAAASEAVGASASVRLGAVATCIDAPRALEQWSSEGDVRCTPGLYECLDDGFVQAALVCRTSELKAGQEAALYRLISTAAPTAAIIRAPRSARSAGTELGSLLSGLGPEGTPPFESPAMVAARAASSPSWTPGSHRPSSLNPALAAVRLIKLPPPPPLSSKLLDAELRALMAVPDGLPHAGKTHAPQIMLAYGTVCALPEQDADEPVDIADDGPPPADSATGAVDLNADPNALQRLSIDCSPNAWRAPSRSPIDDGAAAAAARGIYSTAAEVDGLAFVCRGLEPQQLAERLLACRPLPQLIPKVTRATIPPERLAALRLHLRDNVPLPEDVFFDGRVYVEMDGTKSEEHPDLEQAVLELIGELNSEIERANASAKEENAKADADATAYLGQLAM